MSHIVDSLRKHQKVIVLGLALGVISLYMLPLDQAVSAILGPNGPPGLQNAIDRVGEIRDRIAANDRIPDDAQYRIVSHLGEVQDHLRDVQYRIINL